MTLQPSKNIVDFIKGYEQFRSKAYMPTPNDVPTIGYGHTKGVKMGDTITIEEATKIFTVELAEFSKEILACVAVPLIQQEYDAILSLVYNIGIGAFKRSNCLRLLNSGMKPEFIVAACHPTHGFVRQNGQILAGLVDRRAKEMKIFNTGKYVIKNV